MRFHAEVLGARQQKVLRLLGPLSSRQAFYLGGGTAVALYLGHRRSLDLHWFSEGRLTDPMRLARVIRDEGVPLVTVQVERGTLHGTVSGVPVSFLEYGYPLLAPPAAWPEHGCPLASLDDLACMKISALAQRGSKKDFVDVYALGLKHRPLEDMLRLYRKKYGIEDTVHVLYGLAYFDDADRERMPRMLWGVEWRTIKRTIQRWVKTLAG